MIESIKIKRGILTHKRVLEINHKGDIFTFQATNHRDRFPDELIDELIQLASEMQDHNDLMYIRDQDRK